MEVGDVRKAIESAGRPKIGRDLEMEMKMRESVSVNVGGEEHWNGAGKSKRSIRDEVVDAREEGEESAAEARKGSGVSKIRSM